MAHASALEILYSSLGNEKSALLRHLPFNKVKFEGQHEIPHAIPTAIFFGTDKTGVSVQERQLFWIYLSRKALVLYFHAYYPDGEPGHLWMVDDVLKSAQAHEAFKFATDSRKLIVLATYYFLKWNKGKVRGLTMTKDDEHVLLSICEDIREASRRPSRIVKLPISAPRELFDVTISQTIEGAQRVSVSSDSEAEDMSGDGVDTAHAYSSSGSASIISEHSQVQTAVTDCLTTSYHDIIAEEVELQQELEGRRCCLEVLRQRMETLQAELNQEFSKVETLFERQSVCETERKRKFEAMSSDELRKLCQGDGKRSRFQ